jgi:DNA-binding transcriptional ArsR family regulator/uncharacterized protein YndB with AHSA1/START domain
MSGDRDVWGALANPVRRKVLDELRHQPRTTGELAAAFPGLSRFAVMQHLGVLEDAGLLLVRRQGRIRVNHLNPTPLQEVRERWLHGFSEHAARADLALKRHVETSQQHRHEESQVEVTTKTARSVHTESEMRIMASPDRVFTALTTEQHRWYPYTYGGERTRDIVFEPRVGGIVYEDWGDGAGHLYGTVMHYEPPTTVTTRGGLPGSTVLENTFALVPDGDATIVRHSMTAFGDLSDAEVEGIGSHGDMSLFEPQLRAWVEDGRSVR